MATRRGSRPPGDVPAEGSGTRFDHVFRDVDVELAPLVRDDGEEIEQKVTARGLLLEALDRFRPFERLAWPKAALNERYINGEQFYGLKGSVPESTVVVPDWPNWLPKTQENLLRNLHLTQVARVTSKDPSVKAWGGDTSMGDVADANVANKLIYSMRTNQDHRKLISRGAWTCAAQTACAFYVTWNPNGGPRDAMGNHEGDIAFEPLQVFDWGTDGSEEIEKSEYCYVRRWMNKDEARRRLLKAGINEPPAEQTVQGVWGDTSLSQVECFELWFKPNPDGRLPDGFYCIFVSGHVVAHGPFPYDHGELPLSIWKCVDKPDSPHGGTHVDDAVPLQAKLNRLEAAVASITARSARWLKVITSKAIAEAWNADDQVIGNDDPAARRDTQIIGPPPPPALLFNQIEETRTQLSVVFGVNEAVSGADSGQESANAKHLKFISQLDAQKFAMTMTARDHALLRAYRQILRLYQQLVKVPRMVRIIGENGLPEVLQFVGADLDGVDLYLEPAPGADMTRAANAAGAETDAVSGFLDVTKASELRATGQATTSFEGVARTIVQKQIQDVLAGAAAAPDPSVPAEVAIREIQLAMDASATLPDQQKQPLLALLAAYQQAAAQQVAQQQVQPKQAPGMTPEEPLQ